MTVTEATAEIFWKAFTGLSQREKRAVMTRLLDDKSFREDLIDLSIIERRNSEPSRSLEEVLKDIRKKRN